VRLTLPLTQTSLPSPLPPRYRAVPLPRCAGQDEAGRMRREKDFAYPPPRSEAQRGRGTMPTGPARSDRPDDRLRMVEGAQAVR